MSADAHAASDPQAFGQMRPRPRALAAMAAGSTPATEVTVPSSASSPTTRYDDSMSAGIAPIAAMMPSDRQVVVASLLRQVGGREIDGDALRRQGEPGRDERGADALLGFRHGFVAEANDREEDVPAGDLNLDVDGPGLDALERDRRYSNNHEVRSPPEHPSLRKASSADKEGAHGPAPRRLLF